MNRVTIDHDETELRILAHDGRVMASAVWAIEPDKVDAIITLFERRGMDDEAAQVRELRRINAQPTL